MSESEKSTLSNSAFSALTQAKEEIETLTFKLAGAMEQLGKGLRCGGGHKDAGCGAVISIGDVYRCTDCTVPFHRECARQHFQAALSPPQAIEKQREKDHGAALGSQPSGSSAETVAHPTSEKPPTIWAVWMPFKKSGFPVLGTFGKTERKVVIVPMETWNALCAEIPALQTKQFNVGSYE